ncbi:conserved exported hypothetical protein [Burkholderia sp. 8Y]|uniref:hypothetical protein n=1 Tax=Burkholderia sp. 8Y TaxID=2653133 RepID=UPI0012F2D842|nr:hypothetical protein [Burkholderia sp. 8Y]VXA93539.1 conserved exported hypothetical protein [Burkholderia sp. 8Y]
MNISPHRHALLCAALLASAHAHADPAACGVLQGEAGNALTLQEGARADLAQGDKAVHGALHIYRDGAVYRVYWQPDGSAEQYVLANAGENSVRLVSTPRGSKVDAGPGTLPPQQVLSCPAL